MTPAERALAAGAVLGAALAVLGLREPGGPAPMPPGAVARVGERAIPQARLDRALAALAADRDTPLVVGQREDTLQRLIDEEVLVQEAVALGLAQADPRTRALLATAVLDRWAASARDALPPPSDAALQAFLDAHAASFAVADRVAIDAWAWRGPGAEQEARAAAATLARGEALAPAPLGVPVPSGPVPPDALVPLLGPALAREVVELGPGDATPPRPHDGAWLVVRLVDRTPGGPPPLDRIRDEVHAAWALAQQEAAVRARLDAARAARGVERAGGDP